MLVLAAAVLMLLGRLDPGLVTGLRTTLVDAATPVIEIVSQPIEFIGGTLDEVEAIVLLRAQNRQLMAENERLREWQRRAYQLEMQNEALKAQLNLVPEPLPRYVSARVVADTGGAFVQSVLVGAGAADGIRRSQPVINGDGVVGRITEVGEHSARVLLLSDLNARIPVQVTSTGDRAVVAGDNSARLRLLYVPRNAPVSAGDTVVTSGDGGIFPPGLPVGTLSEVGERGALVTPFADFERLDYVRVLDYGPAGIIPAPEGRSGL